MRSQSRTPHVPGHPTTLRRLALALSKLPLVLALTGGSVFAAQTTAAPASATALLDNPYERGPAPTVAGIEAARGPFAIAQTTVTSATVGGTFGGGTITYPTDTSQGTFGAVAVVPGFTGSQSGIAWLGPRLASQGFVVITIDTNSLFDFPDARGRQLLAALDYLTQQSTVRTRIDATRLGVMGHSMGGGGSLEAATTRPALQATVPLAPWHTTKTWPGVQTPTLIIGAENDSVAPVAQHSEPFYTSIPAPEKAYLEMDNASHGAPAAQNTITAKYSISWLKRFIDNDTRYDQFLCPAPTGTGISEYRDTCPLT